MSDKEGNVFAGFAPLKEATSDAEATGFPVRPRKVVDADEVLVQLSTRVTRRARRKAKRDADALGRSMQEHLERLIMDFDPRQ